MYYSLIGILALLILLIINHDVLLRKKEELSSPAQRVYRWFLQGITAYYVSDILWGILDRLSLMSLLYADTVIYFIAMGLGILFWTQYVVAYLDEKTIFSSILCGAGLTFFSAMIALMLANFFAPIMFWFDEAGSYHPGAARHVMLGIQILLFLLTSAYALFTIIKAGSAERKRYRTIGSFGLIMALLLFIQMFYPLFPLYSIGYMLGSCLLRTFVIEDEKEEYRKDLEASLSREKAQLEELNTTWTLAYKDALTGVRSKLAYVEKESELDRAIADGMKGDLAVVVFDVNSLKHINDTKGHVAGDKVIQEAARMICNTFKHSPVYRIGGDEFIATLEGSDYEHRDELLSEFNRQVEKNRTTDRPIVSAGLANYLPGEDKRYDHVFKRADRRMYQRKEELKKADDRR